MDINTSSECELLKWFAHPKQSIAQGQIDKDKFCRYEAYRRVGITNMLDFRTVSAYTNLTIKQIGIIIDHYNQLSKLCYDEELINHYKECIDDKTSRIQDVSWRLYEL